MLEFPLLIGYLEEEVGLGRWVAVVPPPQKRVDIPFFGRGEMGDWHQRLLERKNRVEVVPWEVVSSSCSDSVRMQVVKDASMDNTPEAIEREKKRLGRLLATIDASLCIERTVESHLSTLYILNTGSVTHKKAIRQALLPESHLFVEKTSVEHSSVDGVFVSDARTLAIRQRARLRMRRPLWLTLLLKLFLLSIGLYVLSLLYAVVIANQ